MVTKLVSELEAEADKWVGTTRIALLLRQAAAALRAAAEPKATHFTEADIHRVCHALSKTCVMVLGVGEHHDGPCVPENCKSMRVALNRE